MLPAARQWQVEPSAGRAFARAQLDASPSRPETSLIANLLPPLSLWDLILIAGVSCQATLLAYLPHPKWKAFLLTLPVPFTFATLAVGTPVDASNVVGLLLLVGYGLGVYWLSARLRVPVVVAIVLCALAYCAAGWALLPSVPATAQAFWVSAAVVFALGALIYRLMPFRDEPSYRSPLPVYLKLPLIMLVIAVLVIIKKHLGGFMALFPMVGVVAFYEGRKCLWTMSRQLPVVTMTLLPMMAAVRLLQPLLGLGPALACGWVVFMAILLPSFQRQWRQGSSQP